MHVALFTETYYPQINGVTYTVANWRRTLEDRGHMVSVIYPDSGHDPDAGEYPVPSLSFPFVDGYRVGVSFPGDLSVRLPPVDVVHSHGPFILGLLGKRIARRDGAALVATHHTPAEHYYDYVTDRSLLQQAMDAAYRTWLRRFYRCCDTVMAPSRFASDQLMRKIGRPVLPLSNGIDTEFFSPRDTTFREQHGLGDGPLVGYCGRLGYEKRLDDLIALARRFDGEVVVAGDGFARDHYTARFRKVDNITYLGRLDREEMPAFYSALDVFVLPSVAETQGLVVLEANACGTPVIGADAAALTETVQDGVNGFRYPPGDITALADRVDTVLAQRGALSTGAQAVADDHTLDSVVDRLLDLYREAS